MLISGILTAVGFVAIAAKFSAEFLKKVLGYDWLVDAVMTLGLMVFFASTGTISGVMTSVITGLSISLVLWITRNLYGYSKLEKKEDGKYGWVEHYGKWTPRYLGNKLHAGFVGKIQSVFKEFKAGYAGEPEALVA